jgi:dTDP-4-dehydrorhamnose 3,5-epimerase
MQIANLPLEGLKLISPRIFRDERGFFFEMYRSDRYAEHGISIPFVQDNCSFSKKGTIRALHFQSDPGQAKLVSCIYGTIWDVAVDIRPFSPTFGKWEALILDHADHRQLFIPNGFAHGFCVLSDGGALVKYKTSSNYNGSTERSIRWNDPEIAIEWPIDCPNLSDRDRTSPFFKEVFP